MSDLTASQTRKKDEMQRDYKQKICRLQQQIDELRQQETSITDTQQSQCSTRTSPASPLRLHIQSLEREEDRVMRDQLRLVKDVGRRLQRIEDIGCSYFKPRVARQRMQEDLFRRLDKGLLHGIVKQQHLNNVL